MSESPATAARQRVASMMRLDFYRLFHTPAFFIMLAVSALIPALVLTTSGTGATGVDAAGGTQPSITYTNAWQLVESTGGSATGADPLDFGGYANINMVFIFAGLLMAIFVSHDYMSGFAKSIFTVHSEKMDYVVSKTAIGIVGGAGMVLAYIVGAVASGLILGVSFEVGVVGLILCVVSKILLMAVFCSLFLAISVFFREKLWITIVFTFLVGMILYPAASVATLDSTLVTVLVSLVAGALGALAVSGLSTLILTRRDLA